MVLIWNALFAVLQIPLEGKKYKKYMLLQIPLAFLLGYVTDFAKWLIKNFEVSIYTFQICVCIFGIMLTAFGVYLTVEANLIMNGPEAFLHSLSNRLGKSFGSLKMLFDILNVLVAFLIAIILYRYPLGIREGTILSAIFTGYFVKLYDRIRKLIYKV